MFKGSIDYALFNGDSSSSKVVINEKEASNIDGPNAKAGSVQKSN